MRVLFFGTPEFAVPSLKALLGSHEVVAVVTRPDRPSGRGQKVTASPIKATAEAHGTRVLQPSRMGDPQWLKDIAEVRSDIAVVAAYGRLLPQVLLQPVGIRIEVDSPAVSATDNVERLEVTHFLAL